MLYINILILTCQAEFKIIFENTEKTCLNSAKNFIKTLIFTAFCDIINKLGIKYQRSQKASDVGGQ